MDIELRSRKIAVHMRLAGVTIGTLLSVACALKHFQRNEHEEQRSQQEYCDTKRRGWVMQEEQREEQYAEIHVSAQFAQRRAETLQERVAAYRNALRSDPRIVRLSTLDMTRPSKVTDGTIPFHLHQNTRSGYELDWALQEMSPHHPAISGADQRQLERWARSPLAPEQALRLYKHYVIVGAPGTGKTTMLKYLALQAIDQQLKDLPDLPIHIELPAFARSGYLDLLEYASVVWQERYGFPQEEALDYIQQQLQNGDALLLLDGFGETGAGSTKEAAENASFQTSQAITDVAARFQSAPIVVTARTACSHLHTRLDSFVELEVQDVRFEESKRFVERWFATHSDPSMRGNAPAFLAKLERTPRMWAVLANPLLLSLMLIVYEDLHDLPVRRAHLYDQYVDTQLRAWNASRKIHRMPAFKPEHHRQLLEVVAWHLHQQGQSTFLESELLEVIAAFLPTVGLPAEHNGLVLGEITTGNGLLWEQASGLYGFVHLTLQEYCAAHYAVRHQELSILVQKREDPWWQKVLLFSAGCIADVSLLVQQILGLTHSQSLQDDLFHTNLILAGHCLAEAVPVRHISLFSEVVTRLFQVLKTSRYALTQAQVAETLAEFDDPTIHDQLVQLLVDEHLDWSLRQHIAEALGQFGARSIVPQLIQLLSNKQLDSQVRQSITHLLGQLAERSSCSRLVHLLYDERMDPHIRQQITEAFRQFEERSIAPQLVELLSDENLDMHLRQSLVDALGQLGVRSIAPQLAQLLSDEQMDWPMRESITYALIQLRERSIAPQLVQFLSDEQLNTYLRQRIAEALGQLGEHSVAPQLVQLLSNRQVNPRVRGSTAVGLAQLGERSIAPQLLQLLTDWKLDQSVRQSIAEALGRSGDPTMVPQLIELLFDRQIDQWVRANIAHALGQIGGRSVASQLVQLLSNRELASPVRESITHVLGQLGERSIASQMLQLLSDEQEEWSVRRSIPHVLGQLGERSVVPQLLQLLSDVQLDWSLRLQIAEALGQLRVRAMTPQLVQLLSEEDIRWPVRQYLAYTMGNMEKRAVASKLLELLTGKQPGWPVRQRIAYALGQIGERSIAPQLVELLSDERINSRVRESIAYALGQLGERSVAPQLVELLSDKQLDVQLHERIAGALGRIGEPSIVPRVVQLLSDEQLNSRVRQCIAEALSTLATDEATIQALAALLPTSDIVDSIHHLLWTMSRQMGVRIFIADRPNDNSDQMAFRIERI
jgi:HEAT repeat protein